MNRDAAHMLGELIIALTSQSATVRVTGEKNLMNGTYLKVQTYLVYGGGNKVAELSQLVTEEDLLHIADPVAMADIIINKIRADNGITGKRG